jgi:ATP-dependent protease ClpP protease subunit
MPGTFEDNVFHIGEFDEMLETQITVPLTVEIEKQAGLKHGRIDLWINSYGGMVHVCENLVVLVELAKREGVTVRTIVPHAAFSCGSILAVTGTVGERYIGKKGEHLLHHGSVMSFETTPKQVDRFAEWKHRNFKSGLDHYKKYAAVPNLDEEMLDDAYFVPANKAIKFKLADKYIDKLTFD